MRRWTLRVFALFLCGCMFGGSERAVSGLEIRAAVVGLRLDNADPKLRSSLERGEVWVGASEAQLYVSRGSPRLWWNTAFGNTPCRVFVHSAADPSLAEFAVTTCNGFVVQTVPIKPALPCWRLAEVGPRIVKELAYFEGRPLEVQWQIVIGLLHRGQAEQDVIIAFGDPANRGFDEREDGKRAEQIVFLDHSGDAYGLNVTMIDNKVVAWKMPAERRLTPEAEQRKLEAVEKRLNERIAQLEQITVRQHQETVKLFGDVMSKQDQMMAELTKPPQIVVVPAEGGSPSPPDTGPNTRTGPPDSISTPPVTKQPKAIELPPAKTCSCPEIPCNDHFNAIKVDTCSAKCMGAEPACSCSGKCNRSGTGNSLVITASQHKCGCN